MLENEILANDNLGNDIKMITSLDFSDSNLMIFHTVVMMLKI